MMWGKAPGLPAQRIRKSLTGQTGDSSGAPARRCPEIGAEGRAPSQGPHPHHLRREGSNTEIRVSLMVLGADLGEKKAPGLPAVRGKGEYRQQTRSHLNLTAAG